MKAREINSFLLAWYSAKYLPGTLSIWSVLVAVMRTKQLIAEEARKIDTLWISTSLSSFRYNH
jgi:hypothetical protein